MKKINCYVSGLMIAVFLLSAIICPAQQPIPLSTIIENPSFIECAELEARTDMRNMTAKERRLFGQITDRQLEGLTAARKRCAASRTNAEQPLGIFSLVLENPSLIECSKLEASTDFFTMTAEQRQAYGRLSKEHLENVQTARKKCAENKSLGSQTGGIFATMLENPSLIECTNLEARMDILKMTAEERKRFGELKTAEIEELTKVLKKCNEDKITAEPSFLSYKTVRDNFGKRIGDSFIVVQVNIRNESPTSQFFVQEIGLMLDPDQCQKAAEYYNEIEVVEVGDENRQIEDKQSSQPKVQIDPEILQIIADNKADRTKKANIKLGECLTYFNKNFEYPTQFSPVQRDTVLGVATANLNRSPRNIFFRGLRFAADMSGVLTGMSLLGPDGIKGFSFLGTTVYNSADTALPTISMGKMENLKKTMPEDLVIINSRSAKTFNVFIPTDRFFSKDTWEMYKQKTNKMDEKSLRLRRMIELFLVSKVSGVLISSDSPKVTLKPGGGANSLESFKKP